MTVLAPRTSAVLAPLQRWWLRFWGVADDRNGVPLPPSVLARRIVVVALAVVAPFGVAGYAMASSADHLTVYAVDDRGHVIHDGAAVKSGQHITIYATGFAARARVEVVDVARRDISYVTANGDGTAQSAFVVPQTTRYDRRPVVAFAGADTHSSSDAATGGSAEGSADRGALAATVPLLREFGYHPPGNGNGNGVDAGGVGLGNGTHTHSPQASGDLAGTGTDLAGLVVGGLALLAAGVALYLFGKRRRGHRSVVGER
jgi:hypothetical protein